MTDRTISVPVDLLNNLLALIDHSIGFESHPAHGYAPFWRRL
jgi:hypothetical protein